MLIERRQWEVGPKSLHYMALKRLAEQGMAVFEDITARRKVYEPTHLAHEVAKLL